MHYVNTVGLCGYLRVSLLRLLLTKECAVLYRNILHLQTVFVSCLFKMLSGRSVLYYNKFRILLAAKSKNNNNILRR